jgi:hypothetical protein
VAAVGVLWLVPVFLSVATGGKFGAADALGVFFGVACIVEGPLVLWLKVVRGSKAMGKEVTVSVTEDGIDYRAGLVSMNVPWDRVRHVDSRKDYWILLVDRVDRIILYKGAFTREQLAELSLFFAARPSVIGSRRRLG